MRKISRNLISSARIIALVSCVVSVPSLGFAGANYGQASDLFNIGAGARSMAMGGAFVGLSDDASASYYNPAGLAFMDEHQLMVMHAPLFIDTSYNYIATANPLGDKLGALAFSDAMLLSDGFQRRDKFNNSTGTDELNNSAIFASYAHKIGQKMSAGLNTKFIQQKIAGFSDNALGFDLGLMYQAAPVLRIGATFANFNKPSITLQSAEDEYRPVTKLGLASDVFRGRLTLTADFLKPSQEEKQYAAGAEFAVNRFLNLRTGFNANRSYTLGMGVNVKTLRVDYAFSDSDIGTFNKVSLTWAWHNIYETEVAPPMKEGRAVYPLGGFENQVAFKTSIPSQTVARWTLQINGQDGKPVRTLEGDLRPPATISWDAKNAVGEPVVDGLYTYHFTVNYKNGKFWENHGDITLALPDHQMKEVIDMSLQLNGTKETEVQNAQSAPVSNTPAEVAPVEPMKMETPATPAESTAQ